MRDSETEHEDSSVKISYNPTLWLKMRLADYAGEVSDE